MEEGEIPTTNIPTKDGEREACGDLIPKSLHDTSGDGFRKYLVRTSCLGGTWEKMVKQRKISQLVVSPSQCLSQGSQEISEQDPPLSTRGRKTQRHHREQDAKSEIKLGRQKNIEETNLLKNTIMLEEQEWITSL